MVTIYIFDCVTSANNLYVNPREVVTEFARIKELAPSFPNASPFVVANMGCLRP